MVKISDALGDRMKQQEAASTERKALRGLPLVARLDGRSFHTFTRGLPKPYSHEFLLAMENTTAALVEEFHCKVGYTQSDEITLGWKAVDDTATQWPFGGRFQKLESVIASYAACVFLKEVQVLLPQKAHLNPCFDCRVWQPPHVEDAVNAFLWRQRDCEKNSISMVAQSFFSHKQLHGLTTGELVEKLRIEKGVDFAADYSYRFQRGVFAKRVTVEKHLTPAELEKIPENRRPTGPVMRSMIELFDGWRLDNMSAAQREFILFGETA